MAAIDPSQSGKNYEIRPHDAGSQGQHAAQGGEQGKRSGMSVTSMNPGLAKQIAENDSLEELTLTNQTRQSQKKAIESRDAKFKKEAQHAASPVDLANGYVDLLPDLKDPQKLLKFLQQIRSMQNLNPDQVLKQVRQTFEDPTLQHAALSFTEEILEQDPSAKSQLEAVKQAKAQLEVQSGKEVYTGYQSTPTNQELEILAAQMGWPSEERLRKIQKLREDYRDIIFNSEGAAAAYLAFFNRYGPNQVRKMLIYFLQAMLQEVDKMGPFPEKNELESIMRGLQDMRSIYKGHEDMNKLYDKIEKQAKTLGITLPTVTPQ